MGDGKDMLKLPPVAKQRGGQVDLSSELDVFCQGKMKWDKWMVLADMTHVRCKVE